MLQIKTFKGGFDSNFCYLIYDKETKNCAVIDTSVNPETIMNYIKENNLKLNFVIIMHSHFDHLIGYDYYKGNKIQIYAHESFKKEVNKKLKHGDQIKLGNSYLKVLHTPGHIYDSICILTGKKLFTSDTLFIDGCGRCDLPGADINEMYNSLYNIILKLPEETVVYPGHDYGSRPYESIKEQKQTNYFLQAKSKESFFRTRLGI